MESAIPDNILTDPYPLHRAARDGLPEVIAGLLKAGYAVNVGTYDLVRPLHEACARGNIECIQQLIDAGAEIDVRNIDGSTPLCEASSHGNLDCVVLLLGYGAKVNPKLLWTTPLHEAVLRDHWQCAQLLVAAGANVNANDCHFGTPLHITAYKCYQKSAQVLLKAGAHVNASKIHHTALHDVARHQDLSFLTLMLECGANVHAVNNHGLKAYDLVPAHSPSALLLAWWERNPASLQHYCIHQIRKCLTEKQLQYISTLNIPRSLQASLNYDQSFRVDVEAI